MQCNGIELKTALTILLYVINDNEDQESKPIKNYSQCNE